MKKCSVCHEEKDFTEFYKRNASPDGLAYECNKCHKIRNKGRQRQDYKSRWYQDNKDQLSEKAKEYYKDNKNVRRLTLANKLYGVSAEEYFSLYEKYSSSCAICKVSEEKLARFLNIDHDHETGEVRGLLCNSCNLGLGVFKDNKELLKKAWEYLEENVSNI